MNNNNKFELKLYYTNIFPYEIFCKWLLLHSKYPLTHREISFDYQTEVTTSYVERYKCIKDHTALKQYLLNKCPDKLDIGSVYNRSFENYTSDSKDNKEKPIPDEKELVFDIDLSDYDYFDNKKKTQDNTTNIRICCNGQKQICSKCWPIIIMSMKILRYYLSDLFNFKHYMWVFSGKKGIHAWISDETVKREYTDNMRKNLIQFISYKELYVINHNPIYNYIYTQFLLPCFEELVKIQDYFGTRELCLSFLKSNNNYYFSSDVQIKIMFIFNEKFDEENSIIRWKLLLHFAEHGTVSGVDKMIKKMIFEKLYPKLDENVSIKKSHLLKAPFSIHPGTGNICVPILDIENAQLETLLQLNLNNIIHNHKSDLLLPYIQIFTEKAEQQ